MGDSGLPLKREVNMKFKSGVTDVWTVYSEDKSLTGRVPFVEGKGFMAGRFAQTVPAGFRKSILKCLEESHCDETLKLYVDRLGRVCFRQDNAPLVIFSKRFEKEEKILLAHDLVCQLVGNRPLVD
jgi:hypothetical protein